MNLNFNHAITSLKYGSDYISAAKKALKLWDYNKDGKTTAVEMNRNLVDTYSNYFQDDNELLQKSDDLAARQTEIYNSYAGEDGVLDEYEYSEALNSDEYGATIDEFSKMKAQHQYGQDYVDSWQQYVEGQDKNGDGKTTADDMYQSRMEIYNNLFSYDPELMAQGQELAKKYRQAWQLYANSDGNIESYNVALAINSDTFKKLDAEYDKLYEQSMYHYEGQEMQQIDSNFIPDGQVTKGEVKVSNRDFYSQLSVTEGSDTKMQEIIAQEEALIDEFSGDDGVFTTEEYHQYKNSEEYKQILFQLSEVTE